MDELRGHLVDVCKDARNGTDPPTSRTKIAAAINKGEQAVSRFEQGVGGWHTQTGELVAAYAEVAGVEPVELWQLAIDRWKSSQASAPAEADRPANVSGTHTARDKVGSLLDSAKPGSQKKAQRRSS